MWNIVLDGLLKRPSNSFKPSFNFHWRAIWIHNLGNVKQRIRQGLSNKGGSCALHTVWEAGKDDTFKSTVQSTVIRPNKQVTHLGRCYPGSESGVELGFTHKQGRWPRWALLTCRRKLGIETETHARTVCLHGQALLHCATVWWPCMVQSNASRLASLQSTACRPCLGGK